MTSEEQVAPKPEPGDELTLIGRSFLLRDMSGRVWIAPQGPLTPGGVMPHLVVGDVVTVIGESPGGIEVQKAADPENHETSPLDVAAYELSKRLSEHVLAVLA